MPSIGQEVVHRCQIATGIQIPQSPRSWLVVETFSTGTAAFHGSALNRNAVNDYNHRVVKGSSVFRRGEMAQGFSP